MIPSPTGPDYTQPLSNGDLCRGFPCTMNKLTGDVGALFLKVPKNSGLVDFNPTSVKREIPPSQAVEGIFGCDTAPISSKPTQTDPDIPALTAKNACPDSYYKAAVVPGARYRLYIQQPTDKADLWVFDKDNTYSTPICAPPYERDDVQACTFTATGNTVYFAVDGSRTAAGAQYTLGMLLPFEAEGSNAAPKAIDGAALPINTIGSVAKDTTLGIGSAGDSYYKVTGLAAGAYIVALPAMADNVDLYAYGDDSTFTNLLCRPFQGGGTAESCVVKITGTTLYFAVDGYFTLDGGAYLISLGVAAPEGTPSQPIDLGASPASHFGYAVTGVGDARVIPTDPNDSYYTVNVTSGSTYRVQVEQLGDQADLWVYADSGYTTPVCSQLFADNPENADTTNSGGGRLSCNGAATSGTLFIVVDGSVGTAGAATFRLRIDQQGDSNFFTPIPLSGGVGTVGMPVLAGGNTNFGDPSDRVLQFDPEPGKHYRVSLINLNDNVDLYVFRGQVNGVVFKTLLCQSRNSGTTPEVCETSSAGGFIDDGGADNSRIYIGVDGFPASGGANVTVRVEEIP